MIRGIYTAAAGLATAHLRLGVVSNNVANASTPGYKQDRLPEEVGKALDLMKFATDSQGNPIGQITLGPRSGLSELDLGLGQFQETGEPLDLAIGGPGFFAVQGADGQTRYTRDGGFGVDSLGVLRARDGSAVLDQTGAQIVLPDGKVEVADDGSILVDGQTQAQLQIVNFADNQQLLKQGKGMFAPDGGGQPTAIADPHLYQGYIEGSNVDMTDSMVAVMNLVRAYEANQRMIQIQDETLSRTVNDIGKV